MGRTIPSFRQLLEIEKLEWSVFKKLLPTKKDKQAFDMIFENTRLYTAYLGNAVNPIVFESVIMGAIFHNYKELLLYSKKVIKVNEDSLKEEIELLTQNNPEGKKLFDRTCKKWYGLIYSLHKDDRELLLKMIIEICSNKECSSKIINIEDSKSCIDYLFFLLVLIQQQQKIMDILLNYKDVINEKKITLLDFIGG
jgi:hypothetical protein